VHPLKAISTAMPAAATTWAFLVVFIALFLYF